MPLSLPRWVLLVATGIVGFVVAFVVAFRLARAFVVGLEPFSRSKLQASAEQLGRC
jgi:hypothetical protein